MYRGNVQISLILISAFIILLLLIFIEPPMGLTQTNDNYDPASLIDKGNALFESGRYQEAIEYYDRVLEIEPSHNKALQQKQVAIDSLQNGLLALRNET